MSGVASRAADAYAGIRSFGWRAIVPPRSFMVDLYGPAASGPLLPLLHLYRWGAIVLRLLRR
jgi:hypothetical protein